MRRGSTPLNRFTSDIDLTGATVYVSYEQDDRMVIDKAGDDVIVEATESGCLIKVRLSQEETLRFRPGRAYIQVRYVTAEGTADASNIVEVMIGKIIKDGEIFYAGSAEEGSDV